MQEPNYAHIKCFGCLFFVPPPTPPLSKDHLHWGHAYNLSVVCRFFHLPLLFPLLLHSPPVACSRVDFGNKVFDKLFGLVKGHGAYIFDVIAANSTNLPDRLCVGPGHKPLSCVVCGTCASNRDVKPGWLLQNTQHIAHVGRHIEIWQENFNIGFFTFEQSITYAYYTCFIHIHNI